MSFPAFSPQNAPHSSGSIQVIFGPMFSGKTSELQRRIRRYELARKKCAIIKFAHDVRYSISDCSTHDKIKHSATPCTELSQAESFCENLQVIGIDEGQFVRLPRFLRFFHFSPQFPDIIEFCENMANAGKLVIVAALDGTFQRKAFGNILNLVPIAESVTKLTAVCTFCGLEAAFSKRISDEESIQVIGGSDKYIATCRTCFSAPLDSDAYTKLAEFAQVRARSCSPTDSPPVQKVLSNESTTSLNSQPPASPSKIPLISQSPLFKPLKDSSLLSDDIDQKDAVCIKN